MADDIKDDSDKKNFKESIKSRKLIFALVVFLVGTILLVYGFVSDVIWSQVTIGVVLGYLTGNVTQNIMGKK